MSNFYDKQKYWQFCARKFQGWQVKYPETRKSVKFEDKEWASFTFIKPNGETLRLCGLNAHGALSEYCNELNAEKTIKAIPYITGYWVQHIDHFEPARVGIRLSLPEYTREFAATDEYPYIASLKAYCQAMGFLTKNGYYAIPRYLP